MDCEEGNWISERPFHDAAVRRGGQRRYATLALGLLLSALPAFALAHGEPAAVLQVVAANADGPRVLRLTEGLAIKLEETWTYVCPNAFGLGTIFLALSSEGERTWVPGARDLMSLESDGSIVARGEPHLASDNVLALAASERAVYALRFAKEGTEVFRLAVSGSERIAQLGKRFNTIVAAEEGDLYLARAEGDQLRVLVLSDTGKEISRQDFDLDLSGAVPRLRVAGKDLFVQVVRPAGSELFRLGRREHHGDFIGAPKPLLADSERIYGPISGPDGTIWASVDPVLYFLGPDLTFEASDRAPGPIACVDARGGRAFACALTALYDLEATGVGKQIMTLQVLSPPSDTHRGLIGSERCRDEWTLFSKDLATIGARRLDASALSVVDAGPGLDGGSRARTSRGSSCSFGPAPSTSNGWKVVGVWLLCGWVVRTRRPLKLAGPMAKR